MKSLVSLTIVCLAAGSAAFATGDAEKGKTVFNKCKACHMIADPAGEILAKGGRTGPNLWGVIGRSAGTGDFRYSKTLINAGEQGLIWDEAELVKYVQDPRGYLKGLGTDGRTKMTFKLKKGAEDVAAYLAGFSEPVLDVVAAPTEAEASVEGSGAEGADAPAE